MYTHNKHAMSSPSSGDIPERIVREFKGLPDIRSFNPQEFVSQCLKDFTSLSQLDKWLSQWQDGQSDEFNALLQDRNADFVKLSSSLHGIDEYVGTIQARLQVVGTYVRSKKSIVDAVWNPQMTRLASLKQSRALEWLLASVLLVKKRLGDFCAATSLPETLERSLGTQARKKGTSTQREEKDSLNEMNKFVESCLSTLDGANPGGPSAATSYNDLKLALNRTVSDGCLDEQLPFGLFQLQRHAYWLGVARSLLVIWDSAVSRHDRELCLRLDEDTFLRISTWLQQHIDSFRQECSQHRFSLRALTEKLLQIFWRAFLESNPAHFTILCRLVEHCAHTGFVDLLVESVHRCVCSVHVTKMQLSRRLQALLKAEQTAWAKKKGELCLGDSSIRGDLVHEGAWELLCDALRAVTPGLRCVLRAVWDHYVVSQRRNDEFVRVAMLLLQRGLWAPFQQALHGNLQSLTMLAPTPTHFLRYFHTIQVFAQSCVTTVARIAHDKQRPSLTTKLRSSLNLDTTPFVLAFRNTAVSQFYSVGEICASRIKSAGSDTFDDHNDGWNTWAERLAVPFSEECKETALYQVCTGYRVCFPATRELLLVMQALYSGGLSSKSDSTELLPCPLFAAEFPLPVLKLSRQFMATYTEWLETLIPEDSESKDQNGLKVLNSQVSQLHKHPEIAMCCVINDLWTISRFLSCVIIPTALKRVPEHLHTMISGALWGGEDSKTCPLLQPLMVKFMEGVRTTTCGSPCIAQGVQTVLRLRTLLRSSSDVQYVNFFLTPISFVMNVLRLTDAPCKQTVLCSVVSSVLEQFNGACETLLSLVRRTEESLSRLGGGGSSSSVSKESEVRSNLRSGLCDIHRVLLKVREVQGLLPCLETKHITTGNCTCDTNSPLREVWATLKKTLE